jgi:hypothetical protein
MRLSADDGRTRLAGGSSLPLGDLGGCEGCVIGGNGSRSSSGDSGPADTSEARASGGIRRLDGLLGPNGIDCADKIWAATDQAKPSDINTINRHRWRRRPNRTWALIALIPMFAQQFSSVLTKFSSSRQVGENH